MNMYLIGAVLCSYLGFGALFLQIETNGVTGFQYVAIGAMASSIALLVNYIRSQHKELKFIMKGHAEKIESVYEETLDKYHHISEMGTTAINNQTRETMLNTRALESLSQLIREKLRV